MSARPFQAEDPFCSADIANEPDVRKVILQELSKARASDVERVRREALEEAMSIICVNRHVFPDAKSPEMAEALIRSLIDKPGEG